jgi:hypothetical protein
MNERVEESGEGTVLRGEQIENKYPTKKEKFCPRRI